MRVATVLLATLAVVTAARAERSAQPVSTYSIVARDAETGQVGVAVQSHWFSVGSIVTWAEAGVGAVATQSFARPDYGPELLSDLRSGLAPEEALRRRTAADPGRDVRQVGVVDAIGRVAAHTGPACIRSASHELGDAFSVQANIMANDGVVPAMARAFRTAEGDLSERLLGALEAAQAAGGDLRGRQSAALLVVEGTRQPEPWQGVVVELRVEDHDRPLHELRRLLRVQRAYQAANAGDEHLAAGDVDAALAEYARAEALLPEQVELSYWRAMSLLDRGHEAEAFVILRRVFAREPAWVDMAPRLAEAGHLAADAATLRRIAALAPAFDLREAVAAADPRRIRKDVDRLAAFGTRHTLSATEGEKRGIGAARRWVAAEMRRISKKHYDGRLQVELVRHHVAPGRRIPDGADVVNVVATLPGSDPGRLVVLSGHLDSRASDPLDASIDAPGANDDASGVAAVLEAARVLGGLTPRATLVFLAVSGEEQGLLGSRAQAEAWKQQGLDVVAMLTMDIVGGAVGSSGLHEPWRLRAFSEGVPTEGRVVGSDADAPSRQLARYFERAAEAAVPGLDVTLVFRQDRYLRGGDHRPFNALGWPAIRLTEPHENYEWQHQDVRVVDGVQHGDLPENVDEEYVTRVARAVAATAGELALAPPSPKDVAVDVSGLTPHTTLSWEQPDPGARHAVLLRRTHEPTWTERRVLADGSETTLHRISKDDWLFGVEAFDEGGHRSLPVYPSPRR